MSKWAYRILGMVMLLFFLMVMTCMQKQLVTLQRQRGVEPTTTAR